MYQRLKFLKSTSIDAGLLRLEYDCMQVYQDALQASTVIRRLSSTICDFLCCMTQTFENFAEFQTHVVNKFDIWQIVCYKSVYFESVICLGVNTFFVVQIFFLRLQIVSKQPKLIFNHLKDSTREVFMVLLKSFQFWLSKFSSVVWIFARMVRRAQNYQFVAVSSLKSDIICEIFLKNLKKVELAHGFSGFDIVQPGLRSYLLVMFFS
eukprot:TRINITY_DN8645_c0_g1_i6.p2 TRINITY_DN8645_c0_g1~~TRINITY_DN8645_c0_g1_i6.p2  ORF type:complete len:208 (-),score=3.42 TRINITY_DN8645_c0_g1_i6:429-1052(-)